MCDKLLTRSKARELLLAAGLTEWRARLVLDRAISPHPHGLHSRKLWLKSRVKSWLDSHLTPPHSAPVIPGEECRTPGAPHPRP
jgi:hypothetical protein